MDAELFSGDINFHPVIRIRAVQIHDHPGRLRFGQITSGLPAGFVMLFDRESGFPVTLFNLFLKATTAGRTIARWKETQESYADDLANWYAFLKFRRKSAANATRADLEEYRDILTDGISSDTGQSFSDSTRRRRLGTVITCYKWLANQGHLETRAFEDTISIVIRDDGAVEDPSELLPPKPRADAHISVVPLKMLRKILSCLGPNIQDREAYGPSIRDRTCCETALATAMRVDEIANIDVHKILDLVRQIDPEDPNQLFDLQLEKTKGRPTRVVVIAQRLLKKLLIYIRGERAEVCRRAVELFGAERQSSDKLFISLISANRRDLGRAASADTLSRKFSAAAKTVGHIRRERRSVIGVDGLPERNSKGAVITELHTLAANTIHDLRHTYVVISYRALSKKGVKNPWKEISRILGHKTVQTTIDTYGRHVEIDEADISDVLDEMLYERDTWAEGFAA